MTRLWGGGPTLSDAQTAELFRRHMPPAEIPADMSRRVTERVMTAVLHRRATFYSNAPSPQPSQPSQGGQSSGGNGDRATVQDHKDRANDLKKIAGGGSK